MEYLEGKFKIFLAEDDLSLASAMEDMLRFLDYAVVGPFHTLESARKGVEQEQFDAAVLDINLGGEKAFELAAMIEARNIPLMFMSGLKDSLPMSLSRHYKCVDKGTLMLDLESEVHDLARRARS